MATPKQAAKDLIEHLLDGVTAVEPMVRKLG